jgi:N-acetyl-anhydromuramyl-L-alanine amidase AmpD
MITIFKKIATLFTKKATTVDKPKSAHIIPNAPLIKPKVVKSKKSTAKFLETIKLSPQTNGQYAQKIKPTAIVMHDTGGNYLGSIDWTSNIFYPNSKRHLYASYHCIIARDGRRTITNHDDNRAYHAGKSIFNSRTGLNNWSIGVAFERDSHKEPLQEDAMLSAIEYMLPLMKKWKIVPDMVTDHRSVSPGRKVDLKKEEFEKFHALLKKHYNNS